jgi:hypothetical protein
MSEGQDEQGRIRVVGFLILVAIALFFVLYAPGLYQSADPDLITSEDVPPDRSPWPERGIECGSAQARTLAEDTVACHMLHDLGIRWVHVRVAAWLPGGASRLEYSTSDLTDVASAVRSLRLRGFAVALEASIVPPLPPAADTTGTVQRIAASYADFLADLAACAADAHADMLHLGSVTGDPAFPAGVSLSALNGIRGIFPGQIAMQQRDDDGLWTSLAARCDRVSSIVPWERIASGDAAVPAAHMQKRHTVRLEGYPPSAPGPFGYTWHPHEYTGDEARLIAGASATLVATLRARDPLEGFLLPGGAILRLLREDPAALLKLRDEITRTRKRELEHRLNGRKPELRQSPASETSGDVPSLSS